MLSNISLLCLITFMFELVSSLTIIFFIFLWDKFVFDSFEEKCSIDLKRKEKEFNEKYDFTELRISIIFQMPSYARLRRSCPL